MNTGSGSGMACLLLNLPAELRNHIYELVAWDTTFINIRPDGRIANKSAILHSCRQIREEGSPVFDYLAPTAAQVIRAKVHNFDFAPLAQLLDGVSGGRSSMIIFKKRLQIQIFMDEHYIKHAELLADWLRYQSAHEDVLLSTTYQFEVNAYKIESAFEETVRKSELDKKALLAWGWLRVYWKNCLDQREEAKGQQEMETKIV